MSYADDGIVHWTEFDRSRLHGKEGVKKEYKIDGTLTTLYQCELIYNHGTVDAPAFDDFIMVHPECNVDGINTRYAPACKIVYDVHNNPEHRTFIDTLNDVLDRIIEIINENKKSLLLPKFDVAAVKSNPLSVGLKPFYYVNVNPATGEEYPGVPFTFLCKLGEKDFALSRFVGPSGESEDVAMLRDLMMVGTPLVHYRQVCVRQKTLCSVQTQLHTLYLKDISAKAAPTRGISIQQMYAQQDPLAVDRFKQKRDELYRSNSASKAGAREAEDAKALSYLGSAPSLSASARDDVPQPTDGAGTVDDHVSLPQPVRSAPVRRI